MTIKLGRDPTAGYYSGLIVIDTVNLLHGALSDQVLIYTVVKHWLLATDRHCITLSLLLNLHLCWAMQVIVKPDMVDPFQSIVYIKSWSSLFLRTESIKCTEGAYLAFCSNFVKAMYA